MYLPMKLATEGTQDEEQSKNTTQYMLEITIRKQTYNVNKTWDFLQTTGGKDEPSTPSF
jgi:hypothetical protein